jgi:hypothetical protein
VDVGLERLLAPPPQPATSPQHDNRMEIVHRLIEALDPTVYPSLASASAASPGAEATPDPSVVSGRSARASSPSGNRSPALSGLSGERVAPAISAELTFSGWWHAAR